MIPRYSRPQMAALWTEERKLSLWLEVEIAALEGWAALGVVPADVPAAVRAGARVDAARVAEIEAVTRHDVAAFVQSVEEQVGESAGRWVHYGMTSSDVLDTTLAINLRDAADLLIADVDALRAAVRRRAFEHKMTPMIGRSHGIHAEPTTLGHMFATWYDELGRGRARLFAAREVVAVGKVSGAVGTFANVPPSVEAHVCAALGLRAEPASTQIVHRDRHAELFAAMALLATSLERFAVQIRHMQRTEVGEAEERFHVGQKGSSAMPHKRNPVLSENISGLARLIRGYLTPAMEDVVLWHERDISHSSVERVIAPDATTMLDFALARMTRLVDDLVIYPERMRQNLDQTRGLPFSQGVLLALIRAGASRQASYVMVQRVAMRAWEERLDFEALVRADADLCAALSPAALDECFSLDHALRHIPDIFERVFGPEVG